LGTTILKERPARRRRAFLEECRNQLARGDLARSRHGVFKVEDQRIGAGAVGFGELLLAIAGDEQERTRQLHCGRFFCKPERLQCATSSPR
jgi:hypothetical protein